MRRLTMWGTAAAMAVLGTMPAMAMAVLGTMPAMATGPGVIPVQYGGPMMGGPGYGMPPDFEPGMGPPGMGPPDMGPPGLEPGPFMGPGPYGPGPYGRDPYGPRRRQASHGRIGPFQTYHGFRIDVGEAQGRIDLASALAEVRNQIDIVDRAGVSPAMLARFRAVPIRISVTFAGGGSHFNGGSEVTLGSLQPSDTRPVLLHEYMHVLEFKTFPGGFRNATVRRFFDEARARGLYPPDSYMMSNPAEFFAVTASCFLHGSVARDPYTRDTIRARQPDYYAYLSRLFGPRLDSAAAGRDSAQPHASVTTAVAALP